jgi:hypothetical protein
MLISLQQKEIFENPLEYGVPVPGTAIWSCTCRVPYKVKRLLEIFFGFKTMKVGKEFIFLEIVQYVPVHKIGHKKQGCGSRLT